MGEITHVYIPCHILQMDLTIVERLILALAVSFGEKGIIMSNNRLAAGLGISRRTVITAVGRLKSLGLLCECGSHIGHRLIARADLQKATGEKDAPVLVQDLHPSDATGAENAPQVVQNLHSTGAIPAPITKGTEDITTLSRERGSFIAPSIEEVQAYIAENKLSVDAAAFHRYFAESGWVDSRGCKVRNWRQKLLSWHSHGKGKSNGKRDDGIVRTFGGLTSKYGITINADDDPPMFVRGSH
jgi:biotin operon repressor